MNDHPAKRARLLALLDTHGADRLLLHSAPAVSWYLDGARVHVALNAPPIVAVLVGRDGDEVLAGDNERDRLVAEELPSWVAVRTLRWFESLPGALPAGTLDEDAVATALRAARAPLLPQETARYRELGQDAATVLTDVLAAVRGPDTEREVAGRIADGLVARGADPLVVLVGGASRLRHRHPLPTAAPLGRRALAVVCARRHGMIANLSRWVRPGTARPGEDAADRRLLAVEAEFLRSSRPGARLADALASGAAAYPRHGFDVDTWLRHHQGGAAGYAGRDPRATPGAPDRIVAGQALAWNPTAPGGKVEDTVLVGADGLAEVLTRDPRWPVETIDGLARPAVLAP